MLVCTFAGHRIINEDKIGPLVTAALEKLIARDDDLLFYTGGMGDFDLLCGRLVRRAKRQHPKKRIRLVLVEPYMKASINTDRERLFSLYDDVQVPIELAGCHPKSAIGKRNRLMVDRADCLIACVTRDDGGAYQTLQYARRRGIEIIDVSGAM